MTLYRKVQKIIFDTGKEVIPEGGEYALFDGLHLMVVKDEDMSVRFVDVEDRDFQLILSHEKCKHPLCLEEDAFNPWLDDNTFDEKDEIESEDIEKLLEPISKYFSNIQIEEEDLSHDIFKQFSIDSSDGGKFQIFFGVDIIRKRTVPFLEIQNKDRKIKKTVFKTYLNKKNIKKIFNSITSLKEVIDKEVVKLKNKKNNSSKQKESV